MTPYVFTVQNADGSVAAQSSITLPDLRTTWTHVAELADRIDEPGSRIRVTDPDGKVVILIGVTTARASMSAGLAA